MKQFIVDAFTDKIFGGNPAAVCVTDKFLSDELMQNIAMENNLSETAFAVKEGSIYRLRWFTPVAEVNLCGHATLAASHIIFAQVEPQSDVIEYETLSGRLTVTRRGDLLEMDFPAYDYKKIPVTEAMSEAVGAEVLEAYLERDLLMVIESAEAVVNLKPNFHKLMELEARTQAVTAIGSGEFDCVSRVFAPKLTIDEDPVTGSTHCMIAPYWAGRLGKQRITAWQASKRGGILHCEVMGRRVKIAGKAALFAVAELNL